jgi:hypothetical protein
VSDVVADPLLAAVARHGSVLATGLLAEAPLAPDAWARLLAGARRHRLVGLLASAVQDGALAVLDDQQAELDDVERSTAIHVVQVERLLLSLTAALAAAGVGSLVLKGPALAHGTYAEPSLRPFTDVDVLVRSDDLDEAVTVLAALGIRRKVPALRPGFDRRFAKSVTCAGPGGLEVDLHRALAAGPLNSVLADDLLFDVAEGFELAGRPLACLDLPGSFLHAAAHLVLGGAEVLVNVRDLVELEAAPGFDAALVARRATAWQLAAVVAEALVRARSLLSLPPEWAAELAGLLVVTPGEQAVLEAHPRFGGREDVLTLQTVGRLPTFRAKAAFVAARAWPTTEHLRARGLTRREHLRRLVGRAAATDRP